MLIVWGGGAQDQQGWQPFAVGFVWTAVAALTIVEPPTLDLCLASVISLNPVRGIVSLNPVRGIRKCCSI